MNLQSLKHILSEQHESITLEFKKSTAQLKAAGKTLCAFLNSIGGMVLIGITDKGKIVGQEITDSTKRLIGNTLAQLSPEPSIKASYIKIDKNKQVVALEAVANDILKPYTFDGKPYIRLESNTITMPREQYQRMSVHNAFNNISWETNIIKNATLADLDTEEILKTIKEGLLNNRIPETSDTNNPMNSLKRLSLLNDNKLTNAAIVLFAKNPTHWFPQCKIRLACFKGTDKCEFIDNKQFSGNVFKIREEAMTFVTRYLPISTRIVPGKDERIDEPLFPLNALREIFSNAVCHRDYSIREGTISLGIYRDRIEVWDPGKLPPEVTYENLKTLHESKPRNPLIANTLYCRKFTESWGRGIEMIINLCTAAGHPEPEFFERTGGFCVKLKSKQMIGAPRITEETRIVTGSKLNILEQKILQALNKQGQMKTVDVVELLEHKIAPRTVQKYLKHLYGLNLIHKKGSGKNTYWEKKEG